MTAAKPKVELVCYNCGNHFFVQPNAAKQKYCSKACYDHARQSTMHARYHKTRVNGQQMNVARYLLEQMIGRPLKHDEFAHHVNGNKLDDRLDNVELVTPKQHSRIHNLGRPLSEETKRKQSESHLGLRFPNRKPSTAEGNRKRSESMKRARREHPEHWTKRWPK